jgi:hypothetical protein
LQLNLITFTQRNQIYLAMLSGPYIKPWFFRFTLLTFLPMLALAQNTAQVNAEIEPQTVIIDQLLPISNDLLGEVSKTIPEPHRGYLIELIVFENTQHIELGEQDNNDYSLPDDRPTNREIIYPAIPDELFSHIERLQLNTLYQPIAYTTWRQISEPRGDSPRFQLNEIAPSLSGTVMIYDNVILLTELQVEYNPALGTAAANMSILDIPEQKPVLVDDSSLNNYRAASNREIVPIKNGVLTTENENVGSNSMIDLSGNPILITAQTPYTGDFYPIPFSTAQSYIYRRVSHKSARYLINEKRRVKFEETHYFDHPAFGILLRVIRTEIPVSEYNLSAVEALGIPPFSTAPSVTNDPIDALDPRPVNPGTEIF